MAFSSPYWWLADLSSLLSVSPRVPGISHRACLSLGENISVIPVFRFTDNVLLKPTLTATVPFGACCYLWECEERQPDSVAFFFCLVMAIARQPWLYFCALFVSRSLGSADHSHRNVHCFSLLLAEGNVSSNLIPSLSRDPQWALAVSVAVSALYSFFLFGLLPLCHLQMFKCTGPLMCSYMEQGFFCGIIAV